jgi:hypothetical protein
MLTLRDGTSAKARYNGKAASISKASGAGWTSVCIQGSGERVKWRTGHWDPCSAAAVAAPALLSVPADAMSCILSNLNVSDVCTCMAVAKIFHAARDLPMTWADADFISIPQGKRMAFALFLVQLGAHLRRLRVHVGQQEHEMLCALLDASCATSLRTVEFRLVPQPYLLRLPAIDDAVIDVDAPRANELAALSLPPSLRRPGCAGRDGLAAICTALEQLPAVCSLTIGTPSPSLSAPPERLWPTYPRMTSVKFLECFFPGADSVHGAVAGLPSLEHLVLRVGYKQNLQLKSNSLRVVDMRQSSKGSSISRLDCPKLERLMCGMYNGYGNGVLMLNPYTQTTFDPDLRDGWDPQELLGERKYSMDPVQFVPFATIYRGDEQDDEPHAPLQVPDGCEVSWNHPKIFACPSTPAIALYHELKMSEDLRSLGRSYGVQIPQSMVERFRQEAIAHLRQNRTIQVIRGGRRATLTYVGGLLGEDDERASDGYGW